MALAAAGNAGERGGMTTKDTSDEDRPGGQAMPSRQVIEELLRAAVAAPSLHNTQPWRFRVQESGAVIELTLDSARVLPVADPDGRAAHIACGAALLNLRIAAATAGWQPHIRLLPDPGRPMLMAGVQLAGPHRTTGWERELYAAIFRRQTNREPFSNHPVPPHVRTELADAAGMENATLQMPSQAEAGRLLQLAADAERYLLADPAYRVELARWAGGERDRDGIPDRALGPKPGAGHSPVREFSPQPHPGTVRHAWFEEHPQLAVLSVSGDGPRDWLIAGQALQRVWLTATCRGISVCPLTQPLETGDAWLVRCRGSAAGKPQMILRIGYGLLIPPGSPRRPVADVTDRP
jgi:nitroreductase